jgi:Family of unknown function (DUF6263)
MLQSNGRIGLLRMLLAAVVFALGAVPAQAQVTLRYKYKEGEQLQYEMQQKMDMKMKVGGNEFGMKMDQHMDMTWKVVKVDPDGKAQVMHRIDNIRVNMDTPQGKVEYDSATKQQPQGPVGQAIAPIFNAMAGAEFSATMDAQGKMSNVKLPGKLVEAIKDKLAGAPGFGELFSPESLKRMVNQGTLVLPKDAVNKGQTWTEKQEVKMPFGAMHVTNTMTYDGPGGAGGLQKIGLAPSMAMEADPNAPVKIKMKGSNGKGYAVFDNEAGRLVEVNMSQDMQSEISAGPQDITQSIQTAIVLKLKK